MLINCYFPANPKRDETLKGLDATSDCSTTMPDTMCYLCHLVWMFN